MISLALFLFYMNYNTQTFLPTSTAKIIVIFSVWWEALINFKHTCHWSSTSHFFMSQNWKTMFSTSPALSLSLRGKKINNKWIVLIVNCLTDSIGGLAFNGQISWWSDDGDDNVDANMGPFLHRFHQTIERHFDVKPNEWWSKKRVLQWMWMVQWKRLCCLKKLKPQIAR